MDTPWSDCGDGNIEAVPLLNNGEAERRGPVIDVSRLSEADRKANAAPFVGYAATMRVDFAPDPGRVGADMRDIQDARSSPFDADERVQVDLKAASIDYMLKQLLGGALGVNYVAPAGLPGEVTFRTEEPIPKRQLMEVVRDILARNGLAIRFSNGVFHVGEPELIASIGEIAGEGRQGEASTQVIPLRGRQAEQLVAIASQIVPRTVRLLASSDGRSVIVNAAPSEFAEVRSLIANLADQSAGERQVAILPLRQAEPATVAAYLQQFYVEQLPGAAVTIVPLAEQQALLVGAPDAAAMQDLAALARQMDRGAAEAPTLRVIPLQNITAAEMAQQLTQIFGGGSGGEGGPVDQPAPSNGSGNGSAGSGPGLAIQPTLSSDAPLADGEEDAGGDLKAPRLVATPGRGGGASREEPGRRVQEAFVSFQAAAEPAASGGPRIVPDTRSNALMIYSSYDDFRRIKDVIQTLDVPQAQVVIEATVAEVELGDKIDKGVQFFLESNGFSVGSGADSNISGGGSIGYTGTVGNLRADVLLQALQAVTKVKVISSPYLTVLDGKSARLVIGDQIPYAKRSQTSNNAGNVTVTEEIDIKDTGIILEVTPQIKASNAVALQVQQEVSTPVASTSGTDSAPVIKTRDITSEILVQSGRTVLLGGLIQDRLERTENGVPVLRSVPALGELFKQSNDTIRRTELIVMITPRVVRHTSQIEDITRLLRSQTHLGP